jgi:hypothetical protein
MPLQATSGAASYDAFGGGVAAVPQYIEDVFSTYLYTGNGTSQTITNGIDLAGKGGLVWCKGRNYVEYHGLFDTVRGRTKALYSNDTAAEANAADTIGSFNSNGFSLGSDSWINTNTKSIVSWTFRKQPKFFDVVTYTGNGTSGLTVSHNLGSTPGCIIVKSTTSAVDWAVYHTSLGATKFLNLNLTNASTTGSSYWNNTEPTSTNFTVGNSGRTNGNGETYVAYLFAHNAGGFGLTGTDNVISCGSFTTDGSGNFSVNLGYEPQWVMIKSTNNTGVSAAQQNWIMMDNMRGFVTQSGNGARLRANTSEAESTTNDFGLTATGFESLGNMSASAPFIYIAIRRGPMKVPTSGTSVFSPVAQTNTGSQPFSVTAGFPVDSAWFGQRNGWGVNFITSDRLRGATNLLLTTSTNSEADNNSTYGPSVSRLDSNTQFKDGMTNASEPDIYWMFRRAPGYFDEVCYTGNGATQNITHNLGVAPELMVVKKRSVGGTSNWAVYASPLANADAYLFLNDTAAVNTSSVLWNSTAPTSTVFSLGGSTNINQNGETAIAYLFATCAGVSKVGSYTGTATTKQIDCGFTAGARFVLIKRTDSTGDWYVWDTARGIVSGNDPYLLLNSTAAEVTNTDYIDTYSAGFEISSTAPAAINASGGTFIFFAVA